jgi:hypothetical protein
MAVRRRLREKSFTIFPDPRITSCQTKKPHETPWGEWHGSFSRRARPLRHGRVAWLTAFQPITVAGPRPIHTAFPAALACKLKFECKLRPRECQCASEKWTGKFSDSSSWACGFPPGRAGLLANLRGGRVRSRKCSWNVSGHRAETCPCRREWLFSPWSAPGQNGR